MFDRSPVFRQKFCLEITVKFIKEEFVYCDSSKKEPFVRLWLMWSNGDNGEIRPETQTITLCCNQMTNWTLQMFENRNGIFQVNISLEMDDIFFWNGWWFILVFWYCELILEKISRSSRNLMKLVNLGSSDWTQPIRTISYWKHIR